MGRYRELPRIQRLLAIHLEDDRREEADFQKDYSQDHDPSYTPAEAETAFRDLHPQLAERRDYSGADINTPVDEHDANQLLVDLRASRDKGGKKLKNLSRDEMGTHISGEMDVRAAVAKRHSTSPLRFAGDQGY